MTKSPMLWGLGLACALGGAVAGNALGSAPLIDKSGIVAFYQSHEDAVFSRQTAEAALLPDHYALVTRGGTVPVAKLSDRGLYSQARYRGVYAADVNQQPRYEEANFPGVSVQSRYEGDDESVHVGDSVSQPPMGRTNGTIQEAPSAPLALSAGPGTVARAGHAKLIDVNATLAMR